MKTPNQRRLLVGLFVIAVVMLLGSWLFTNQEPEYAGKPVSYWFKEYCLSGQHMNWDEWRHKESSAALKALGTNAVPYLLTQAFNTSQDSAGWSNFCRLSGELPPSWRLPRFVSHGVMRAEAGFALQEIKPPADQLLRLMEKNLKSTNHLEYGEAIWILGTGGDGAEKAVPDLIVALTNQDHWARVIGIQSLGWISPKADAAAPALIEVLKKPRDTNYPPTGAAIALGKIGGSNALPAIPLVKEIFEQEKNWNLRCSLATALFRIDPAQTEALDFLIDGVTNHQPASDRWIAAMQLGEIGPAAKPAAPILLEVLNGTNDMLFSQIPNALKKMGVAAETFLPIMKSRLNSNNETTRANAAARILEIDPADHEAHLALMGIIKNETFFQTFAIDTLGKAGPGAAEALPLLREVAANGSGQNRSAALKAIKQIQSKPLEKH